MVYAPSHLRRSGYFLPSPPPRRSHSIAELSPRQEQVLTVFVRDQPARVVGEALIEVAAQRLGVGEMLLLLERWVLLPPEHLRTAGGDRMPPRALRALP
jgi:hypothetical protein